MSRFLILFFAMLGITMITWPGGAAAQYYDPWGPPQDYYAPPMGSYGPSGRPSDSGEDLGGYTPYYEREIATGRSYVIHGVCASACTMKLGARNVCVTRNARLGFHSASYDPDGRRLARDGNRMFMSYYPARIRAWVRQHNALGSSRMTWMSGSEAISLGIRECS